MEYIAYLHKDRDSDFGVSFPDFPGCVSAGKTLEEARKMAAEALAFHIAGMIEDGETVPQPSTLDDLERDTSLRDAVAFLVNVEPQPSRTVRINITVRENQVEKIDELAAAAGMTRSAFMVQSALHRSAPRGVSLASHRTSLRQEKTAVRRNVARRKKLGRKATRG